MKKKPFWLRIGELNTNPGCMILGFGLFVLFGWLSSYDMVWKPWSSWWAARSWNEIRCTIVSSKVVTTPGEGTETWYTADLAYTYVADGLVRRGSRYGFEPTVPSQGLVALYPEGKVTSCWVNPENPDDAVLNRDISFGSMSVISLFPLLFLIAGVGGILWVLAGGARNMRPSYGD